MEINSGMSDELNEVCLEGALTIAEAAEVRDQLALCLVTAPGMVRVNLSKITELDTAGLQLLLALAGERERVVLVQPNTLVRLRAGQAGLAAALGIEESGDGA